METFLKEKIDLIYNRHADHIDEIVLIIPSHRSAVYLQKYLSEISGKVLFSPLIVTINEWIDNHTQERIISQNELLFMLYEVHRQIKNHQVEDFNEFIKWAKIMLSDFDEIDRYLIPANVIFSDLKNIKDIENWSFDTDELSYGQQQFITLWEQFPVYYEKLNLLLADRGEVYQGKAYQKFAEKIDHFEDSFRHYYFLGFNALSTSEERIIKQLIDLKKATFFADIDSFYYNNNEHEAGHFYRKLCEKWKIKPDLGNHFNEIPKKITVIETAQQVGQTVIAGDVLKKENFGDYSTTALVLADETLLIPLLNSLPEEIGKVNITMGYPIKFSHLRSLIDLIFDLQFNFQKFGSSRIYHKSLLRILDHSFIRLLIPNLTAINKLEKDIVVSNTVFVEWADIVEQIPELKGLGSVFVLWKNSAEDGFIAIHDLVSELYASLISSTISNEVELEILYHFSKGYKKFEAIWQAYPHEMDLKSFKRLFYQFWQSERLAFLGNPIDGLQVMGILETRALDFENLIVLGTNEGNLPQTNPTNSYIPFDLRKVRGLPTDEDRQAIYAHHFYRLLHRAKNVYLIYNSGSDDASNAEPSRFITQLFNELDFLKGHQFNEFSFTPKDISSNILKVSYQSNEMLHKRLDAYFEQGISPSALNKLINCPLDFYYRYILGMKESNKVEENVESSTFGTKIHDVLQCVFENNFLKTGAALDVAILKSEKNNLAKYLQEEYEKTFKPSDMRFGQNKLSFDISLQFLHRFIDKQIEEIKNSPDPIEIIALEKDDFEVNYCWEIAGKQKNIKLSGKADRIDRVGDVYRIIDYKSGKCEMDKVRLPESCIQPGGMNDFIYNEGKGYARQLLMYALMFRSVYPDYKKFTAGIVSMVNIGEWLQNLHISKSTELVLADEVMDAFEQELKRVISSLYDPNFVFEHSIKSNYCENCEH